MRLVIVESPAKCGKIESYLGPGYKCVASFGHIREIPDGLKSITLPSPKCTEIERQFVPTFDIVSEKTKTVANIRKFMGNCEEVIIATDDDREGEAIGWHLCVVLKLPFEYTKRIVFHEITKPAIEQAMSNPRRIDLNKVNAQLARQVLDVIVGYSLSPLLWKYVAMGHLSAGRCQTPALRLVYDNYLDINASPGTPNYDVVGYFTKENIPFKLTSDMDAKIVEEFLNESYEHIHTISVGTVKQSIRKPPTPLTTSALQQQASNELGMSPKVTMMMAQILYENGYITYMRTDSRTYSAEFVAEAIKYINDEYGDKYPAKDTTHLCVGAAKQSKTKKKTELAQEAHEAIRPTHIEHAVYSDDAKANRLYQLIRNTTLASCMTPAEYNTVKAQISAPMELKYECVAETLIFDGWQVVKGMAEKVDSRVFNYLTNTVALMKTKQVEYSKITAKFNMKNMKEHYTEARLIHLLEEKGIGRPSTFASLIDKIQERQYVGKEDIRGREVKCVDYTLTTEELEETATKRVFGNEKNKLVVTPLGVSVIEFLLKHFGEMFEYDYTKTMEDDLDVIAKGAKLWNMTCLECYNKIGELKKGLADEPKKPAIKLENGSEVVIGRNGAYIKNQDGTKSNIRKGLDIKELQKGTLDIDDIKEVPVCKYEGEDIFVKTGKFGRYITAGGKNYSLKKFGNKTITEEDIIKVIKGETPNIVRKFTEALSIRTGKYGDYIMYKTDDMDKPAFHKLKGFGGNYKTCDANEFIEWFEENC